MSRNPITIEVLETLDAIDRRGSFARAAEELNKATSAISYTVQKIEEQLDITLFQRQGRRSVLTPAGKLVLAEGREILKATHRLADKAREVATGWEPRIAIGIETLQPLEPVYQAIQTFLQAHPTVELDISETVLNGGWEALEQDRIDLVIGAPGPAPRQKGYRLMPVKLPDLIPVISAAHPLANKAKRNPEKYLPDLRTIVTHDTSVVDITRSAGIASDGKQLFVQNSEHKLAAIMAGIGVGHLSRRTVQSLLTSGKLLPLELTGTVNQACFTAWKLSNKGKGLKALTTILGRELKE